MSKKSRQNGNYRNGKMQKQFQTPIGESTVPDPRGRNGFLDFNLSRSMKLCLLKVYIAKKIISMYALRTKTREISEWMKEKLSSRISAET